MSVDAISFSAHADFPQTSHFVKALAPRHVVLVHGEVNEMFRLRKALEQQARIQPPVPSGRSQRLCVRKALDQPAHRQRLAPVRSVSLGTLRRRTARGRQVQPQRLGPTSLTRMLRPCKALRQRVHLQRSRF